jgi:hypothetical protein
MSDVAVLRMSRADKLAEAMRRSLPHLPLEARHVVEGMLRPETLAIISGTLAIWAGSHFFGVGEIVDIILLGVGVVALGFSVFEGAGELYEFGTTALNANSSAQLDNAAQHFARAVSLLGISIVQAVLLRGQGRAVMSRGQPQMYPRLQLDAPPPAGNGLNLTRPPSIPTGEAGLTSPMA